ncbi:MAG: carboxypeptidase-like regulatory domain-containing protein, partial [Bacteroidetes bacterium]|nr:carboxypeptidase-like regulatory domain-containing protein [Bacteroidota bacterium]
MKGLFTLLFVFCFGTILFAQTTISGTVKDAKTGDLMQGVNIIVLGKSLGTVTDYDGKFSLKINQEPPLMLKVSMVGFVPSLIEINQNNQLVNVSLEETDTELNEVIISASRTPERVMESPVTIERMDIRAIQNTTASSFYDGLENLKGVDVNTNSFTYKSINTRGFATFANTRFVQLVDGMDNASPALNFAIGNMLGMSELDVHTVEILPGASSALYGANAFNGILFMESKNPFEYQGVSFYGKTGYTSQKAAGTNQYVDAGVRLAHAFSDKFAAKVSLSFLNGTEWYATDYEDYYNPGSDRSNPAYDGLNVYGDEVFTSLNFEQIALGAGVPAPVAAMLGSQTVSRTGYNEEDLIDYGAKSIKADISLNYRPNGDDLEFIYNAKFGRGNTIYQGTNRYSIQDFTMSQHKLEVRNDNFFVRAYTTGESAGDSYDTRFAAINVNRSWKSDTQWFTEYAGAYVQTFVGTLMGGGTPDPAVIHQAARAFAQTGALVPGTPGFNQAFDKVVADSDLTTGAKFEDDTKIYHMDANYNFNHLIEFADIQIGGSWRQYSLNSHGSIFTDYDGVINYNEYGAYTQLQKKFADDRMKFTGSIR